VIAERGLAGGLALALQLLPAQDAPVDGPAVPVDELDRELARHGYFSKIEYHRVDDYAPFTLIVQRPPKEPDTYRDYVASEYGPWAQYLEQLFRHELAGPLQLERRADYTGYAVAVLASRGDYINYCPFLKGPVGTHIGSGHYDEKLKMVVTYRDTFQSAGNWKRFPMLRDIVHALLDAYRPAAGERAQEVWFTEGLSSYLAFHLRNKTDDLASHHPHRVALESLGNTLADPAASADLRSLRELIEARGLKGIDWITVQRKGGAAPTDAERQRGYELFEWQATMWAHFLHHGAPERRAAAREYLELVLSNQGGVDAFLATFGLADLAEIEREFHAYVVRLYGETFGRPLAAGAALAAIGGAGDAPGAGAGPTRDSTLARGLDAPRLVLARALWDAGQGALEEAQRSLAELEAASPEGTGERARREQARIAALRAARDARLDDLRRQGGKLRLTPGEKRLGVKVEGVEDGKLVLAPNASGRLEVPLAEVPVSELVSGDATWLRGYALLLEGDARWSRFVRGEFTEREALERDAADVPELLRAGEACATLERLSMAPLPSGSFDAERALGHVRRLLADAGDLDLVRERRDALARYAEHCLRLAFAVRGARDLVHGELEELEGGRVRIRYDFDSPEQGLDFVELTDLWKSQREVSWKVPLTEEEAAFQVLDGELVGLGPVCSRHALPFRAPLVVRYGLVYHEPTAEGQFGIFQMGICVEGENAVCAMNRGGLFVRDDPSGIYEYHAGEAGIHEADATYPMELRHDGAKVGFWNGRELVREQAIGQRGSGWLVVWAHTAYEIGLESLEIEGEVDTVAGSELRDAWVAGQLPELGF